MEGSGAGFGSIRRCAFDSALVIAFLIGARDYRPLLADSFHQVLVAAVRALLRNGFRGRSEFALRIIPATVKSVALARTLFDQLALFAFGTLHADEVLLHIFALGISAAGSELTIATVAQDQVALAQGAGFVQRYVGHFLALIEPPGGFAIGVASTGHELPEASALQDHHPPAVFAVFFLRGLLYVGRIEIVQIDRILLGELTSVWIFFVVGAAGIERTVLAPLDHQG